LTLRRIKCNGIRNKATCPLQLPAYDRTVTRSKCPYECPNGLNFYSLLKKSAGRNWHFQLGAKQLAFFFLWDNRTFEAARKKKKNARRNKRAGDGPRPRMPRQTKGRLRSPGGSVLGRAAPFGSRASGVGRSARDPHRSSKLYRTEGSQQFGKSKDPLLKSAGGVPLPRHSFREHTFWNSAAYDSRLGSRVDCAGSRVRDMPRRLPLRHPETGAGHPSHCCKAHRPSSAIADSSPTSFRESLEIPQRS